MGMYDEVDFQYDCPNCGTTVEDFQTKDTECTLDLVSPVRPDGFYAACSSCNTWLQFTATEVLPLPRERRYTLFMHEDGLYESDAKEVRDVIISRDTKKSRTIEEWEEGEDYENND